VGYNDTYNVTLGSKSFAVFEYTLGFSAISTKNQDLIKNLSNFLNATLSPYSDSGSNFVILSQSTDGGTVYIPQFIGGGICKRLNDDIKNFTLTFDFPDGYKRLNLKMWSFLEPQT
jgi:hypothetical protein